jgi:hypothetical protein
MVVQTSYAATPAIAYGGMLAEQFSNRQVDSFLAEDAIIGGAAVERGTDPDSQVLNLTTATDIYGVAVTSYENKETPEGAVITYAAKEMVPVMETGRIWVYAGGVVAVGDEVTPGVAGASTKWTSGANLLGKNRAFARSAAAADGDLLLIELTGPQGAVA